MRKNNSPIYNAAINGLKNMTKKSAEIIVAIVLCWVSIGSSSLAENKSKVSASETDAVILCKGGYPPEIEIPYTKATEYSRNGDLQNAEKYFADALKAAPPDIQKDIYFYRAQIYRRFGRPNQAIADFEKYSKARPGDYWSKTYIALCYYDENKYEKALQLLKSLPETKDAIGLKGRIAFHKGHYKEAFKDLDWYCQRNLAPELRTKDDNDCEKLRELSLAKLKEGGH